MVSGLPTMPRSTIFFCTSGMTSTSLQAALSLATMSAGSFAGPERPKKFSSTSLAWPSSTTVGTSGISGERAVLVTASGTSWPVLKYCT